VIRLIVGAVALSFIVDGVLTRRAAAVAARENMRKLRIADRPARGPAERRFRVGVRLVVLRGTEHRGNGLDQVRKVSHSAFLVGRKDARDEIDRVLR
jgi:hypothetical protein